MKPDYLIVGTGLTGAVIARRLVDAGRSVLVLDRRAHLGGNVHDHWHPSGIRVHTYGPHYFRTDSDTVWEFVNRFSRFYRYEAVIKSSVDGQYENWPIAGSYIRRTVGSDWAPEFRGDPGNFEEASLALMPRPVYEKFVKGYTEKQWGVPAETLSAGLVRRFDVREDDEPRLMRSRHQGIPADGYAAFFGRLLAGVPVLLQVDYLRSRDQFVARRGVVFTGPIDEYFGHDLGRLRYRGQRREHTYLPDAGLVQPCGQVNYPSPASGPLIRTLEWKHMMEPCYAERIRGTVLTSETPFSPDDANEYEYPFPDEANARLYRRYRSRADAIPGLTVCGRLGEYRYYDMDKAIERAMEIAGELLAGGR